MICVLFTCRAGSRQSAEDKDNRENSVGKRLGTNSLPSNCERLQSSALVRASKEREGKKSYSNTGTSSNSTTQHNHTSTHKMAKDRSEKKDKKEKRKSVDASGVKKEKKEKRKSDATAVLNAIEDAAPGAVAVDADGDVIVDASVVGDDSSDATPIGALVPFANPLCDDKATKKVLKTVKKGEFPFLHSSHCINCALPMEKDSD